MGIALAVVYLPILLATTIVTLVIGVVLIYFGRHDKPASEYGLINYLGGALAALLITSAIPWVYARCFPASWGTILGSLAVSLLGPSAAGLSMLVAHATIKQRKFLSLKFASAGAFHSTLVMPFWGAIVMVVYGNHYAFEDLCKNAEVKFLEKIEPAKSFAFRPDRAGMGMRGSTGDGSTLSLLLAAHTPLRYIDVKYNVSDSFVRMTRRDGLRETSLGSGNESNSLESARIDSSDAEYEVIPSEETIPSNAPQGTRGQEILINRLSDNKPIAYAHYYWNTKEKLECPRNSGRNGFFTDFISNALNLPKYH